MLEEEERKWAGIAAKLHHELSKDEEDDDPDSCKSGESFKSQYEGAKWIHDTLQNNSPVFTNKGKIWDKVKKGTASTKRHFLRSFMKYAAVFVLALAIGLFLKPPVPIEEVRYAEISVPYGQMSQIMLSDSTVVWLNSGTTLKYPDSFSKTQRDVFLEGEAYFEVTHKQNNPFYVHLDDMQVEVVGTSFNVSAYKEDTCSFVTLVEGKVIINNSFGKQITQLTEGQMISKTKNNSNYVVKNNVKTAFYDSWKNGTMLFENQTLEQITSKLERWYNVEIVYADPSIKDYRFTGTILKNKPISQIMQVFELLLSVKFEQKISSNNKDQIIIRKR
jgi:ferric-dicitrate binding protein FerR (iron transport regulator)